jgi:cell division protein FtsW (lipid II flippase)
LATILVVAAGLILVYRATAEVPDRVLRNILWAVIGGLAAYSLYGLGLLPAANWMQRQWRPWGAALVTTAGCIIPFVVMWARRELRR